jgi:5-methyltetrahydropteroyltriglutamate--homocysteine methyltransferase
VTPSCHHTQGSKDAEPLGSDSDQPERVADRIVRFAEDVGRKNVIAPTNCGLVGRVHPHIAWAKLESLVRGAELATRRLWG